VADENVIKNGSFTEMKNGLKWLTDKLNNSPGSHGLFYIYRARQGDL